MIRRNLGHSSKAYIFLEGHTILQNLHRRFILCSNGQIYDGDFANFFGRFRKYELKKYIVCFKVGSRDATQFITKKCRETACELIDASRKLLSHVWLK